MTIDCIFFLLMIFACVCTVVSIIAYNSHKIQEIEHKINWKYEEEIIDLRRWVNDELRKFNERIINMEQQKPTKDKKKVGDLTLREVEAICSNRDNDDNGCKGCPLTNLLYCPTIQKEILDEELEVEE